MCKVEGRSLGTYNGIDDISTDQEICLIDTGTNVTVVFCICDFFFMAFRAINYDEKDPFLCNACGFCKYAKFDFTLTTKPCCAVDPIENDEDRKKVCHASASECLFNKKILKECFLQLITV